MNSLTTMNGLLFKGSQIIAESKSKAIQIGAY